MKKLPEEEEVEEEDQMYHTALPVLPGSEKDLMDVQISQVVQQFQDGINPKWTHLQNIHQVLKPLLLRRKTSLFQEREELVSQFVTAYEDQIQVCHTPRDNAQLLLQPMLRQFLQQHQQLQPNVAVVVENIRMEGWLRKKGQHVNLWRERYFTIRSTAGHPHVLCYFRKKQDKEPRGWYILGPGCTVDEVRESPSKIESKKLFTFRISHYANSPKHKQQDAVQKLVSTLQLQHHHEQQLMEEQSTPSHADLAAHPLGQQINATPPPTPPSCRSTSERSYSYDEQFSTRSIHHSGSNHSIDSMGDNFDAKASYKKQVSRRRRKQAAAAAAAATAVVLTGGLAGVGMGAAAATCAAGAGVTALFATNKGKQAPLALAAESKETADWWRENILDCINQAEEQWRDYVNAQLILQSEIADSSKTKDTSKPPSVRSTKVADEKLLLPTNNRQSSIGNVPRSIAKTIRREKSQGAYLWELYDFRDDLRIYCTDTKANLTTWMKTANRFKTSLIVESSPQEAFAIALDISSSFYDGQCNHVVSSVSLIETIDSHCDILHLTFSNSQFSISPRDACVVRYWRQENDGSYLIFYQSLEHPKCPTTDKAIRIEVDWVEFNFAPRIQLAAEENVGQTLITLMCQINPKGWSNGIFALAFYIFHDFNIWFLQQITALKAIVEQKQFVLDGIAANTNRSHQGSKNRNTVLEDANIVVTPCLKQYRQSLERVKQSQHFSLVSVPLTSMPKEMWEEPPCSNFFVRSSSFFEDQKKEQADTSLFTLVGVDLYEVDKPVENIGCYPGLFVHQMVEQVEGKGEYVEEVKEKMEKPFVFIVNFMITGPPSYSMVLYFIPKDPSRLSDGSAFAELCADFFDGDDDSFRDNRLKVIPNVVQGNWMMKQVIGNLPSVLGHKINQKYYRGANYFEVDCDLSNSSIASTVVQLILGQCSNLILDLGFVLEAQQKDELPEVLLACSRFQEFEFMNAPFLHCLKSK